MSRLLRHGRVRAFCAMMVLACAVPPAIADERTSNRGAQLKLWARAIATLEREAAGADGKPAASDAEADKTPARDKDTAAWLREYQEELASRAVATRKDYHRYVEEAQKSLAANHHYEALIWANRALKNTTDANALIRSDWAKKLVETAVATAEKRYQGARWMKAYSYYDLLTQLFDDNQEYEKRRRACLIHARLDAIYAEDNKWAEGLEGIDPLVVTAALNRIDRHYVEQADFRKIAASGLERLLLLCESKVMRETFDHLENDEDRQAFRIRIQVHLSQVQTESRFNRTRAKEHFEKVFKINRQTIQLPEELITYEMMAGALEPLDEFTSVIWPAEFKEFDKHTRGDFVGVGISITGGGSRPITVVTPLEDAPAYRAGILAGDFITHVNGVSLKGVSLHKAVETITGPIDTSVTLTIHRPSEERDFDFVLKRALVEIFSVKGHDRDADDPQKWNYILDPEQGVGYIRVTSFQENTVDQLHAAIDAAERAGMRGLLLDLRFNPGGLLKTAVELTQLFLDRDESVVSTRGLRDRPWKNAPPDRDGPFTSLPLIVLVNRHSASASEIVSGALQDHGRALIVGEQTFGKFSVQKLMQLVGSEAHLKLTTARYYLPTGRSLHHDDGATEWGIEPDVEVKLVPKEIGKILSMRRGQDILGPAAPDVKEAESDSANQDDQTEVELEEDPEDVIELAADPNERPEIDPQLNTARLLMQLYLLAEGSPRVAAIKDKSSDSEVRKP